MEIRPGKYIVKIILPLILLVIAPPAWSDKFQLVSTDGDYISFAKVEIPGAYSGYTDKYGRITIEIGNGEYNAKVTFQSNAKNVSIRIRGENTVNRIVY